MEPPSDKQQRLSDLLRATGDVVVAYSGGVDSAFLAAVAHDTLGDRSLAVTAVSPSLARTELSAAIELAVSRGWNHRVVATGEVGREEYARNDPDRCYWCKSELFEVLGPVASQRRAEIVVGTNLDDLGDHRPGLKAAEENSVRAPLVEVGLSKAEIRLLSAQMDLPTADKPASPCLASRFAYGVRVTPAGLRRIEAAEAFIRSLGFPVLRVRDHGDLARIEVPKDEIEALAARFDDVQRRLTELGYRYVSLDLAGFRSGSLNEALPLPILRKAQ